MKKTFFILCLLAVALTSCDPVHSIDYQLINSSGHTVTFASVTNPDSLSFWFHHPNGITLEKSKDTVFFCSEGIGSATLERAKGMLSWEKVYGGMITFTFDDGKQLVYTQEEGNGPYDFEGDHYVWATKRGHFFLVYYDYYGCLSYTITEQDYAQAR